MDLDRYWPDWLTDHTRLRDQLVDAYGSPDRGYHDLRHLAEVLARIDEILAARDGGVDRVDRDAVVLAAWFHDAVYDELGNLEGRSAALAEHVLASTPAGRRTIAEVARLVRLTADHQPADDDVDGQVLCDADLAILAAEEPRYRSYVDGVRREYAHVADVDFRRGRAAVLRGLASKPTLFQTAYGREHWEPAARANLARELETLS